MQSIYLILDMQNDLVHADGPNGHSPLGQEVKNRNIVARTAAAIEKARAADIRVGYVRVGFSSDYRECPAGSQVFGGALRAGIFQLSTWGTEIHEALRPGEKDLQIVKHRVSPFYQTSLSLQLRTLGIGRIYCSGVSTQAVVQATARDGHDRDFDVVVLEDCCAAHSEQEHVHSMTSIARFCRAVSSEKVTFASGN